MLSKSLRERSEALGVRRGKSGFVRTAIVSFGGALRDVGGYVEPY